MGHNQQTGTLYIVATPIGNLADMTFRAVDTLKSVDLIAAEDTRHSRKLLNHYGIKTRLASCHEHNEMKRTAGFISDLKSGKNIALISDAGTPTISDPGYKLVTAAATNGIDVIPIPGCSAAIAGLSVSGLPTDSFLFIGFPPKKKQKQKQYIATLKSLAPTLIFYESPKRIKTLIHRAFTILGDRKACLTREISKLHEEYLRGTLSQIHETLDKKDMVKGECALFVQGCLEEKTISDPQLETLILERMTISNLGTSGLAKQISTEFNLSKKKIYDLIVDLENKKS